MNITVRLYGRGRCCSRPDTTWEKENRDFYVPDGAGSLWWTPVAFARISRSGKCIGRKFASRYYDSVNFGLLMYIGDGIGESPEGIACASCADHTSVLPFPLYNPAVFQTAGNRVVFKKDGKTIYSAYSGPEDNSPAALQTVEEAICKASVMTSLRTGDIVAAELAPVAPLVSRESGSAKIEARFCDNPLFDFKIVF